MTNLAQWLRYNLPPGWWMIVILLSATALATASWTRWSREDAIAHGTPVVAKIVGFGRPSSEWQPDRVVVSAADNDGITGSVISSASDLEGCQVGDAIRAERKGVMLKVIPAPCHPR